MPTSDGKIVIDTAVDTSGVQSGLQQIEKFSKAETRNLAMKLSKQYQNLGYDMGQAMAMGWKSAKSYAAQVNNGVTPVVSETEEVVTELGAIVVKQMDRILELLSEVCSAVTDGVIPGIENVTNAATQSTQATNTWGESIHNNLTEFEEDLSDGTIAIRSTEKQATRSGKKVRRGLGLLRLGVNGLSISMRSLTKHALALISLQGLVQLAKSALEVASQLQESMNIVSVSFRALYSDTREVVYDYTGLMHDFSYASLDAFGISRVQANKTAAAFMAMGRGMNLAAEDAANMSINLTALSSDMASFYNVSLDEAVKALEAVYTGETETIKRYGIIINETNLTEYAQAKGITKSISAMTQKEKVLLRYNYLIERLALVEGDFQRTQYNWANQVKILKQNWTEFINILGTGLINVFSPILITLNKIVSTMTQFATALANALGVTTDYTDSSASTVDRVSEVTEAIEDETEALNNSVAAFDKLNVISTNEETQETSVSDVLGDVSLLDSVVKSLKDAQTKTVDDMDKFVDEIVVIINSMNKFIETAKDMFANFGDGEYSLAGMSATNLINIFTTQIEAALKKIDWVSIGNSIGQFIHGIDFVQIFVDLLSLIKTAIESASDLMAGAILGMFGVSDADKIEKLSKGIEKIAAALVIIAGCQKAVTILAAVGTAFDKWHKNLIALLTPQNLGASIKTGLVATALIGIGIGFYHDSASDILSGNMSLSTVLNAVLATAATAVGGVFAASALGISAAITVPVALLVGLTFGFFTASVDKQSLNDKIDELNTEVDSLQVKVKKIVLDVDESDFEYANKLIEEIFTISESDNLTNDQVSTLEAKISQLNKLSLTDFTLQWDNINKTLNTTKEELQAIYDKSLATIKLSAYQDKLKELYRAQLEASEILTEAQKVASEAQEKMMSHYNRQGSNPLYESLMTFITSNEYKDAQKALENARSTYDEITESITKYTTNYENLWSEVYTTTDKETDKVLEQVTDLGDTVDKSLSNSCANGGENMMNNLGSAITDAKPSIISKAQDLANQLSNVFTSTDFTLASRFLDLEFMPKVRIPHLASGAVIPPNKQFMAVLGDQKSGTNIEAPLDTIKQAVAEVLANSGMGANNINVTFDVQGDPEHIFKVVKKEAKLYNNRTGSNYVLG